MRNKAEHGNLLHISIAVLTAMMGVYIHFLFNHRFYFSGDLQIQFLPGFYEIARLLKSGEWPWITLRSWNAGNIAGEYQYGVFNPVSLLVSLWISSFKNLALAGLNLVLVHTVICASGVYLLARYLGVSRPYAALAAFAAATNNHLLYWHAQAPSGLISFAWIPWSTYFLLRSRTDWRYILPSAIFIYMVLSAGYPNTDLGLAAISGLIAVIGFSYDRSIKNFTGISISVVCGGLMALPALYPLIAHFGQSNRVEWNMTGGLDFFLSATFTGLVSFSSPSFLSTTAFFGDNGIRLGVINQPFYYAAWFLLIPFVYMKWENYSFKNQRTLTGILIIALAFFILSMMPNMQAFRWFFKFLPFYHLSLLLAGAWILSHKELMEFSHSRKWFLLSLCVFVFLITVTQSPLKWYVHFGFVIILLFAYGLFDIVSKTSQRNEMWYLFLITIFIFVASSSIWRDHNAGNVSTDYLIPHEIGQFQSFGDQEKEQRVMILSTMVSPAPVHRGEIPPGNDVYFTRHQFINGYSSMHSQGLYRRFCMTYVAIQCDDAAQKLFEYEPETGANYADLMRLDAILVRREKDLAPFIEAKTDNWVEGDEGLMTLWFQRRNPLPKYPGLISYLPDGIKVSEISASTRFEQHLIKIDSDYNGAPIAFARAWYPGYEAALNGKPVEVFALDGFITAVRLPTQVPLEGTLTLSYRLPGSPVTFALALIGLFVAMGVSLIAYRRKLRHVEVAH